MIIPDRVLEKALLESIACPSGSFPVLACVDEVGRGSIAGPVSVGVALVVPATSDAFPEGLRDSKMLSPARREVLAPACRAWAWDLAVGHARAEQIDAEGIVGGLRRAAAAAVAELAERGRRFDAVLLDGTHDWWTQDSLFDSEPVLPQVPVTMKRKGDAACAGVAAASVVAKVERDAFMVLADAEYPGYGWAKNKGYGTKEHAQALARLGASPLHRRSWNLPGLQERE